MCRDGVSGAQSRVGVFGWRSNARAGVVHGGKIAKLRNAMLVLHPRGKCWSASHVGSSAGRRVAAAQRGCIIPKRARSGGLVSVWEDCVVREDGS